MNSHQLTRVVVGVVLAGAAVAAWGVPVGRVILAAGDTFAVREGREIRLALNSPIEARDVLRTGPGAILQVRFTDESIKALRENSELVVDDYQFAGKEDGSEKAIFRLVKGGFRAVTGLIGSTRHANYSVRTSATTIGIRGTDYAVRDCRGDCGADVKDGLYGSVLGASHGTNRISLTNEAGEFEFDVSQHFHVPDAKSAPQRLLRPPTFVSLRPQGNAQAVQQGGSGSGEEQAFAGAGVEAESRPAMIYGTETPLVFVGVYSTPENSTSAASTPTSSTVTPPTFYPGYSAPPSATNANSSPDGTVLVLTPSGPAELTPGSPTGTPTTSTPTGAPGFPVGTMTGLAALSSTAIPHTPGSLSSHIVECDDSNSCSGGGADVITFDSSGYKRIDCGFSCFIDRNLATSSEVGSVAGVIEWGRWNGGPITAGGFYNNLTFGANQGFHYVVGMPASPMPTSGTATFSLLGATTPTFSDGVGGGLGTGTMTAGTATANFLTGSITANMNLAFNGTAGASNYALAMTSGSFSPGTAGLFGSGSLNFSSGAVNVCPSACPAGFAGFFAGANASHVGLGYDVTTTASNPFAINGVAVMRR